MNRPTLNRRTFLAGSLAVGAGAALGACSKGGAPTAAELTTQPTAVNPGLADAIKAAEAARPHTGRTVTAELTPRAVTVDLGGKMAQTFGYADTVPGPLIRANVGDELKVTLTNKLDRPTSMHWHGIALQNDMDGAEPASPNVPAGQAFTYTFSVPDAGTYWAHPHVGLDLDTGLYLPVIVDDPKAPADYDAEWIVMLDDWTDGVGKSPQQIFDALRAGGMGAMGGAGGMAPAPSSTASGGMGGMGSGESTPSSSMESTPAMSPGGSMGTPMTPGGSMGTPIASNMLGGDPGDVIYPYYLINGRIPEAPSTFQAKPGQRIRIRFINAGADTAFRVALAGHRMTVTHTDGFPVVPTDVDALLIGMGERYDVIVTAADGVFPLVASAEGKNALARALLSTGSGAVPEPGFQPPELTRKVGTVDMFAAPPEAQLKFTKADVEMTAELTSADTGYQWGINGFYPDNKPFTIRQGQQAQLTFVNKSRMWHPMHLHGHTFAVLNSDGMQGARKDTVIVLPGQSVKIAILADNPGYWPMHCHNAYHAEAGMINTFDYLT
jgi:FtsP/CotA-like multicopper oxidase with cupredoxin domain